MGRKPLPKGERREVISISLKPATLEAIERMKGMKTRSKWFEEMVEHLLPIFDGLKPQGSIRCTNCYKTQSIGEFDEGDEAQCRNRKCSLVATTWFEVKVVQ